MLKSKRAKIATILGAMLVLLAIVVAGCTSGGGSAGTNTNSDLSKKVDDLQKFAAVQQKSINPGLGTIMIEYSTRMAKAWFAAQAGNWDMARYQIDEMKEIQETGEITRPKRAPQLKKFESKYLDTMDKAAEDKDLNKFQAAYTDAIKGCNDCHTQVKSDEFSNYGFIKVQIPKTDPTGGLQNYSGK